MAKITGFGKPRIMITEETDDWVRWRVACGCDSPVHDWVFDIEWDKEVNEVSMYVYCNVWAGKDRYHYNRLWEGLTNLLRRCKLCLLLLFRGYLEFDTDLMFKTEADVYNLAQALIESVKVMNERNVTYGEVKFIGPGVNSQD